MKVRLFSLGTGETGDIVRQLCNKAVNCRSKNFYQESIYIYRACPLYFTVIAMRSAMLDITEYEMVNREGWLEWYQANTPSNRIKIVVINLFILFIYPDPRTRSRS